MKLPPRPSRSTHSPHSTSLPFSLATHSLRPVQIKHTPIKPGAVVHRKPNKHDFSSCTKEREEVDALDEVVRLNQESLLSVQSGGSAGDVVENKGKEEAELTELIEATKGKGIRAPRSKQLAEMMFLPHNKKNSFDNPLLQPHSLNPSITMLFLPILPS